MSDVFSALRLAIGSARAPDLATQKHDDELVQMSFEQGLHQIVSMSRTPPQERAACPDVTKDMQAQAHLWVVRNEDAVHAAEHCDFGKSLTLGRIKHTNLTGGMAAFTGGELIWLSEAEIILNGCSGRYGAREASELQLAARAFAEAGYRVWSTGYDEDTGRCFRFGASIPVEVLPE